MASLTPQSETGAIQGTVVDARDGTALSRVGVRIQDTGITTQTDDRGRFELSGVPAGAHDLYVSAVGFAPAVRHVDVQAGRTLAVTIVLAERTGPFPEP